MGKGECLRECSPEGFVWSLLRRSRWGDTGHQTSIATAPKSLQMEWFETAQIIILQF